MRTLTERGILMVVLVALAGCASGRPITPTKNPDVISDFELVRHSDLSALQVIRQLRPIWLSDRGGDINVLETMDPVRGAAGITSPRGIKVYVNGIAVRRGLDELAGYSADIVLEMRKLDATDASLRFGLGHTSGAILVRTKG